MNREAYQEYLAGMHWQKERRRALSRAEYRCQVCNTDSVQLEVHHRTYERLGQERPSDLFVLCEQCHDLFSQNGKLARPDGDEVYEEEWDEETALLPEEEEERAGRLQIMMYHAVNHPRLAFGGSSLLFSLGVDLVVRFDPLVTVLGLAAAVTIGWKGEDLMQALVPGSDQEQVQEDAEQFAEGWLADYPVYTDQSVGAKLRRLFHLEEGEIADTLPQKNVRSLPQKQNRKSSNDNGVGSEGLMYERITDLFLSGEISDGRFLALLERIENPKSRNGNRNGTKDEREMALDEAVSPQIEPLRPVGWDEQKEFQLIGAFLATNHLDNSLKALGLSTSQVNRNFAREILKQQGLWKEK